jgi:uncharacterized repeat protein (TIGR01451 family)
LQALNYHNIKNQQLMKRFFTFFALTCTAITAHSQLITAFSPVKTVTQKGDITFAANSITQCTGTGVTCTNGRAEIPPAGTTNNQTTGITIGYIDNDGSTGIAAQTFSSSSATLDMGGIAGCGVIYAYLVWGGFVTTGSTNYAKRDSVYFLAPGGTAYNKMKADTKVDNTSPYNATYHCYKDVTALVKAAGPGSYTIGNVVAATGGTNQFAGWTLIVIYSDVSKPLKNLSIFRGLAGVSGTNSVQFGISGFFTPPSPAPVNVKLGIVAYDGDRAVPNTYSSGLAGDSLKFNGVAVSNGKNPQTDIFNSTITVDNAEIVRTPAYTNTLGYDADIITLANATYSYLGNSASGATIRISSGGETILTDIVTTAIDVFEPEMRFDKTFINVNGNNPAHLGDTIEYTLKVYNKGSDPADSLTVIDSLYGALNFVPGSLSVLSGANSGAKTDAAGDDQMEYVAAGNFIKARLGNGATGTRGGKLNNIAPDSVTSIRFRATITNDCTIFHCFDSVYNMAYATYYGQTSIAYRSTFSTANGIDPGTGCPLSGPTALKVTVPACSLPADTSIANCVSYNLSNVLAARPGYDKFYNSTFTPVTQATATGTYYAIKTIYPSSYYLVPCFDTIQINFTATGACVLPIKLLSFDAVYHKPGIDVNWATSQEINNRYFELERSIDGLNFEKITTVPGSINSQSPRSYHFTDNNFPRFSKLYYRIKQVDMDGGFAVSEIRAVSLPVSETAAFGIDKIMPNPASNKTTISIVSNADKKVTVRFLDAQGKQYLLYNTLLKKGVNLFTTSVLALSTGLYFAEISDTEGTKLTVRFIKN